MNSLNIIQKLSKVACVLSYIVYVSTIIGIIGCAVGAVILFGAGEYLKFGGESLNALIKAHSDMSVPALYAVMLGGAVSCVGQLIVSKMACGYFKGELEAGTPFTLDGASQLMKLGISVIWIPTAATLASQIVHDIIISLTDCVSHVNFASGESVILGVTFVMVSLICRSAAELMQGKEI